MHGDPSQAGTVGEGTDPRYGEMSLDAVGVEMLQQFDEVELGAGQPALMVDEENAGRRPHVRLALQRQRRRPPPPQP